MPSLKRKELKQCRELVDDRLERAKESEGEAKKLKKLRKRLEEMLARRK